MKEFIFLIVMFFVSVWFMAAAICHDGIGYAPETPVIAPLPVEAPQPAPTSMEELLLDYMEK